MRTPLSNTPFLHLKKILRLPVAAAMSVHAELYARYAFSKTYSPPILIYQMGKVASSTVYASLKETSLKNEILHLHFLSQDLPNHRKTHYNSKISYIPYHIYLGESVRKILLASPDKMCKIISLVRDPIAFTISDIFQNPHFTKENITNKDGTIDTLKVYEHVHNILRQPETFRYQNEWFNNELKRVFSIDVLGEPFPLDTGFQTYKQGNIEALVLRVEDLSTTGKYAISDFLDLDGPVTLKYRNVRDKTKDATNYQWLINNLSLDPVLCKEIYSRGIAKHFYDDEMIGQFISKWAK